jgi:hypothetical protein
VAGAIPFLSNSLSMTTVVMDECIIDVDGGYSTLGYVHVCTVTMGTDCTTTTLLGQSKYVDDMGYHFLGTNRNLEKIKSGLKGI